MRRKKRKYIVYINVEYMQALFDNIGATSVREQNHIRMDLIKRIDEFLRGENSTFMSLEQFRDSMGKLVRSIEIVPLPACNMRHIRHQSAHKRIM